MSKHVTPSKRIEPIVFLLDMDETLIHTDFTPSFNYDRTIEVILDKEKTTVYLSLRPGVFEFLGISPNSHQF